MIRPKPPNMRFLKLTVLAVALAVFGVGTIPAAKAANAGVKVGVLTCNEAGGWGFVFASTRELNCTYAPDNKVGYRYIGHISKYGVDIGYVKGGVLVWGVFAPTREMGPEALSGDYAGVTGGASVGVGADANVLIGGSNRSISLQPLSIEGNEGLNVAAGIGEISLHYQPATSNEPPQKTSSP